MFKKKITILAYAHTSTYKLAHNYGDDFTMLLWLPPSCSQKTFRKEMNLLYQNTFREKYEQNV